MPELTEEMAPIDYLVFEFDPSGGHDFQLLLDLVDSGLVRVLDLAFVRGDAHGTVSLLAPSQVPANITSHTSVFEGASSGLLQPDDIAAVAGFLEPEKCAVVLVYENTWTAALVRGQGQSSGCLLAAGEVNPETLLAVLQRVTAPAPVRSARRRLSAAGSSKAAKPLAKRRLLGELKETVGLGLRGMLTERLPHLQAGRWAAQFTRPRVPSCPVRGAPSEAPETVSAEVEDQRTKMALLRELAYLNDRGLLSDAEYETQKRRLLKSWLD